MRVLVQSVAELAVGAVLGAAMVGLLGCSATAVSYETPDGTKAQIVTGTILSERKIEGFEAKAGPTSREVKIGKSESKAEAVKALAEVLSK